MYSWSKIGSVIVAASLVVPASAIIKGLSFFGLETEHRDLMCLWSHPLDWHLQKISSLGFNHLRIPFSYDYVQEANWQRMDELFESSKNYNLNITLDFHRVHNTHQSPAPDAEVSLDQFVGAWETIIARYVDNDNLASIDVFNEFQSSDVVSWNRDARYIIDSLEQKFPDRNLTYLVGGNNWGGLLNGVDLSDMECADRIFYTIHKYSFSDTEPLEEHWDYSFGPHKAIVNVGEFGFVSSNPAQLSWANRFINWLLAKGIRDSFFWSWSWNSGDVQGLLKEDCTTVDEVKMAMLRRYWNVPVHRRQLRRED